MSSDNGDQRRVVSVLSRFQRKDEQHVNGLLRQLRVLAIMSVVGMGGVLGLTAGPAGAATAHPARTTILASSTDAASIGPGYSFGPIYNAGTGWCLGITGGDDDAPAIQWNCNGDKDQQWHVGQANSAFPSYYQIVNDDNQCLGISGGKTTEDTQAVGWTCLGSSHMDQYWYIDLASCDGISDFSLWNLGSEYVLGVQGGSITEGAPVVQFAWQSNTCNNQNWYGQNEP
jgi:hypothetical protein